MAGHNHRAKLVCTPNTICYEPVVGEELISALGEVECSNETIRAEIIKVKDNEIRYKAKVPSKSIKALPIHQSFQIM